MAERSDKDFDVFLVHSLEDKSAAIQIKHELTVRGLKTYAHYDESSSFDIGKPVVDSIMKAINRSKTVLILLTVNTVKSQWVSYEILLALEKSHREGTMCCRLCMVGISEEERRQYQTGELAHIPSVVVDLNRKGWADQLYASIIEKKILPSVAVGLVFSYFVGFLRNILPNLKETIEASDFYKANPGRMLQKFFILLPSSCEIPAIEGGGVGGNPLIKKEGRLSVKAGHGDKARSYNPTVYSINMNEEIWNFVGECPAILETMSKIKKNGFLEIDVRLEVEMFRITLLKLVQHRSLKVCNNLVSFISYDDSVKDKSIQQFIGEAVMAERMKSMPLFSEDSVIYQRVSPTLPKAGREVYFASITHTFTRTDWDTAKEVMTYLTKHRIQVTKDELGDSFLFEVLEKSRWNIFIFSKEAFSDGYFKFKFDAAFHASIDDDEFRVIPVLSKGLKFEDVPSNFKCVTMLSADEPGYTEKLLKVMNGSPAKMTDKYPAGPVYKGLAWAYLLNYLSLALLGKTAEGKSFRERYDEAMVKYKMDCPYFAKIFLIIPTSCSFPPPGSQFPGEEHIGPLEPVVLGFKRFFLQLYRITTSKGKKFCYAREYATPVIAMHEMANAYPFAGLTKDQLFEQTRLFTQYVKDEISRDSFKAKIGDLESRIRLVFFDDMTEKDGKRQNMVEALEHEIDLCLESERPLEPSDIR